MKDARPTAFVAQIWVVIMVLIAMTFLWFASDSPQRLREYRAVQREEQLIEELFAQPPIPASTTLIPPYEEGWLMLEPDPDPVWISEPSWYAIPKPDTEASGPKFRDDQWEGPDFFPPSPVQ